MDSYKLNRGRNEVIVWKIELSVQDSYKSSSSECIWKSWKMYRPQNIIITDFIIEFDDMVQQLSECDIKLLNAVLAYRALKSTNLGEDNEKLIIATIWDITLNEMTVRIKKVMGVWLLERKYLLRSLVYQIKSEPTDVHLAQSFDENSDAQTKDIM